MTTVNTIADCSRTSYLLDRFETQGTLHLDTKVIKLSFMSAARLRLFGCTIRPGDSFATIIWNA
jgi:hypothetical protein